MKEIQFQILRLIKDVEQAKDRCSFDQLEVESVIKGNDLADIVSSLFALGYIRIDNGDEVSLNDSNRRDIIRLWMTPLGQHELINH